MNLRKIAFKPLDKIAFLLGYVPVVEAVALMKNQNRALATAAEVLGEVKRQIERVDTLRNVNIDGYELVALSNLVDDHEELESRIEAVLTMREVHSHETIAESSGKDPMWLHKEEVHHLLRGKQRVPDTVEDLASE